MKLDRKLQGVVLIFILACLSSQAMAGASVPNPPPSQAAIIVTTTSDFPVSGCSLRDAILSANQNTAVGDCISGNLGVDRIVLQAGNSTTPYVLTADLPEIEEDLVIEGPSPSELDVNSIITDTRIIGDRGDSSLRVVDGADLHRLFVIDSGVIALFSGFTITRGLAQVTSTSGPIFVGGGGILVQPDAYLVAAAISVTDSKANGGGGIALQNASAMSDEDLGGNLVLLNSNVSGNESSGPASGGGIRAGVRSSLVIRQSSIVDNRATHPNGGGGGISFFRTLTGLISNTTIAGNTAMDEGGGLSFSVNSSDPTQVNIEHSTIEGNIAALGSLSGRGTNGGGIFYSLSNRDYIQLKGTIVAGNASGVFVLDDIARTFTTLLDAGLSSLGDNIIAVNDNVEDVFPAGLRNVNGDFVGTSDASLFSSIGLGTTVQVGNTFITPISSDSIALDAAGQCGLEEDQLFTTRAICGCDIGAAERPDPNPDDSSCLVDFYVIPLPGGGTVVVPL